MRFIILYLFVYLASGDVQGQKYGYSFTSGWSASLLVKRDSINIVNTLATHPTFGFGFHYFVNDAFTDNLTLQTSSTYLDTAGGEVSNSLHSSFAIDVTDSSIFVGGLYRDSTSDTTYGALYEFSNGVKNINVYNVGYQSFVMDFLKQENRNYLLGSYYKTSAKSNSLRTFITTQDSVFKWTYGCEGFDNEGGCNLDARQLIKVDDGFLTAGSAFSGYEYNLRDPLIIKINELGEEQWRLNLGNDTTSGFNLVVSPLANGNYMATFSDIYWKPKREPPSRDNRNPVFNENATVQVVIFNKYGVILDAYSLTEELRFKGYYNVHSAKHNHIIMNKDSSIIVVGNTENKGTNGAYLGYIMKWDKYGVYQWYRHVELNINGGEGEERLYINGVTELDNGTYAIAGEYRSEASDSFSNGIQQGVIIYTDELGCTSPGCELTDNIDEIHQKKSVTIFPNPSSGVVTVMPFSDDNFEVRVYSVLGNIILAKNFDKLVKINLNNGLYFFHITNLSSGSYVIKKILVN